jgi:hypothetical protein
MRPRVTSYGEISTATESPGTTLIRCVVSRPESFAVTRRELSPIFTSTDARGQYDLEASSSRRGRMTTRHGPSPLIRGYT